MKEQSKDTNVIIRKCNKRQVAMAKSIQLKHKSSGILKTGYFGFSWTTLFFGGFPALFRGDFLTFIGTFVVLFLIGLATHPLLVFVAMFVWAFFYNGYYTKKLLEKGYVFSDFQNTTEEAARELGVSIPTEAETSKEIQTTNRSASSSSSLSSPKIQPTLIKKEDKTLTNDAYKIYLVKKYPLEFNDVLKKYIFKDRLFDTVDDALVVVHQIELESDSIVSQNERVKVYYTNINEAISFLGLIGIEVNESDGKITVKDKTSTQYFYHGTEFLQYANKKAVEMHK